MTGRAIIFLVAGIAMIAGIIMHRVEANGSRIAENYSAYYQRQHAQNVAHSGVSLALRQISNNRLWTAGFGSSGSPYAFIGGKAVVTVDTGVMFQGIPTYRITSTAYTQASTIGDTNVLSTSYTSTAYAYFPATNMPTGIKGLLTLHSSVNVNGSITIDGRDHASWSSSTINAGQGTYGAWTTAPTFSVSGSATIGGTSAGKDSVPISNPGCAIAVNQTMSPSYPGTVDSVMGGASNGYPEGTLKGIAKAGVAGSQYVTDPAKLHFPLAGVTYVELPAGGTWSAADFGSNSTGILVVHNATKDAVLKSAGGNFSGIMIADDVTNFHGNLWGAMVTFTTSPAGTIFANGGANLYYSKASIKSAVSVFSIGSQVRVAGWFE